ncbi:TonB-dependent receptor [Novosphingobium sp. fls2-241-R2A-195]|jgi:iron complex outermembrane receptor protein|uniref:TonB-dependent receptor n=1 Tax=Novosphingobium sp. fls2-241-R2A-195 TaxID=3040296 RepID=UPI00254A087B|nr:TonB-dependent receptor [Novosphingobium sp. fls2-241-R2A-195]
MSRIEIFKSILHVGIGALGLAAGIAATPAWAQNSPAEADSASTGEIIVSARRREEALRDTPVAITAVNAAALEAKASVNIGDIMGAAPSVMITQQNSGAAAANVAIRGLSFADVDKSFDPTVAVVVDGVFIGSSTGQFFDFFDISQIEVLRGPQGTLFGRNTIGGVINIRRTRPKFEFSGKVEASYGNYDTWATRAVVNIPVIDDVLAIKPFYFHNQSDGYYRHGITGDRTGGSNSENFGVAALLQPSSNFDALLTLEKQVQDFVPVNSSITKTGEVFCAFEPANECNRNTTTDLYTVFGTPGTSHYESPAATLEMNLDAGPVKLTSVTGYRKSEEAQTQDFDGSSADIYFSARSQSYRQFSQELRASGKLSDSLDYVVGGYFFKSRYSLLQRTRITLGAPPAVTEQANIGHARSLAFFGDFNWAFADRWRLSFGGRWTQDRKQNMARVDADQFPNASVTNSKFTPKIGIDFHPNPDMMLYASWSRGYRSGGFSGRGTTLFSATTAYGPETVDSFEGGFKGSLFDGLLELNVAAFLADYKDLQQNTTIPTQSGVGSETIVTNVGSAKLKGVEVEFTAHPAQGLTLSGSLGLLDNNLKDFISQGAISATVPGTRTIDYSNVSMIYAPKTTLSLNANYKVPTGFGEVVANLGYRHISPYDQQIGLDATATYPATGTVVVPRNDPRLRSDTQDLVDASLTTRFDLAGHTARVTVFGRNLLDDRGPNAAFTVAGLWSFSSAREPRTYGVILGYEF